MTEREPREPRELRNQGDLADIDRTHAPSQGGSSGGGLQREVGSIDEEKSATGADPQPTSVHKGQKPRGGDEPNLPNRNQTGGPDDHVEPRRS